MSTQRIRRTAALYLVVLLVGPGIGISAAPPKAAKAMAPGALLVQVSPTTLCPPLGQVTKITVAGTDLKNISASILDRDGRLVRSLRPQVREGSPVVFAWDGRDDVAEIVPDEAYCVRVQATKAGKRVSYDPCRGFVPEIEEVKNVVYSEADGVMRYTLRWPARVHIQTGQVRTDDNTGQPVGPILKTVADRLPRSGGAVVESWDGLDESGLFNVSGLPHFMGGVLASSLPENAIIKTGGRSIPFAEYVAKRVPLSARKPRVFPGTFADGSEHAAHDHRRHVGLGSLEDGAPPLRLTLPGVPVHGDRVWRASKPSVRLRAELVGVRVPYFLSQPGRVSVFIDDNPMARIPSSGKTAEIALDLTGLPPGAHRLAVNWASKFGPVAVGTMILEVPSNARAEGPGGGHQANSLPGETQ